MKRAAAILGPTPPFLRWAIEAPCPLVRIAGTHSQRHPAQTRWRQLRGLREIARAKIEGRVHAGYCFATLATAINVVGVKIEEVTAPLGGARLVEESCLHCSANPNPHHGNWAPCTGILPLITPHASLLETRQAWNQQLRSLNQSLTAKPAVAQLRLDPERPLNWYLIWRGPSLESQRLQVARFVLELNAAHFPHAVQERSELQAALEHATRRSLKVWIESVPAGWSDGETWQLPAHCQNCGAEWSGGAAGSCSSCHSSGGYQAERKLKVLGLRPFVRLSQVLGSEPAGQLFSDYQSARKDLPPRSESSGDR